MGSRIPRSCFFRLCWQGLQAFIFLCFYSCSCSLLLGSVQCLSHPITLFLIHFYYYFYPISIFLVMTHTHHLCHPQWGFLILVFILNFFQCSPCPSSAPSSSSSTSAPCSTSAWERWRPSSSSSSLCSYICRPGDPAKPKGTRLPRLDHLPWIKVHTTYL